MTIAKITVDGREYPLAPVEPERHDFPSPAYPMAITPEVARSWLRYNYRNRNQRAGGKRDYSNDMREGRYALNGTTVSWTRPLREGEDEKIPAGHVMLVDGQHRLTACEQSGKPFLVYIVYGLEPEARRTVDTGIKRQLADVFSMDDESNAFVLASIVKRAYAWTHGDQHLLLKKSGLTHAQAEDFFKDHRELRRSAEIAARTQASFLLSTGQQMRQSVTGFAHWLFMQADETRAPEFFARLGDGAEMRFDHPVMLLRRRLVKDRTQKKQERGDSRRDIPNVPDWQMLCYFIRAWNVYLAGPRSDGSYKEFALLAGQDSKRIPDIKTAQDVKDDEAKRSAELEAQERELLKSA